MVMNGAKETHGTQMKETTQTRATVSVWFSLFVSRVFLCTVHNYEPTPTLPTASANERVYITWEKALPHSTYSSSGNLLSFTGEGKGHCSLWLELTFLLSLSPTTVECQSCVNNKILHAKGVRNIKVWVRIKSNIFRWIQSNMAEKATHIHEVIDGEWAKSRDQLPALNHIEKTFQTLLYVYFTWFKAGEWSGLGE